jgi:hypothetical protein
LACRVDTNATAASQTQAQATGNLASPLGSLRGGQSHIRGTPQRQLGTTQLVRIYELARATGKLLRFVIFGSYVHRQART